jgi:hypothetical protein
VTRTVARLLADDEMLARYEADIRSVSPTRRDPAGGKEPKSQNGLTFDRREIADHSGDVKLVGDIDGNGLLDLAATTGDASATPATSGQTGSSRKSPLDSLRWPI